MSQKSLKTLGIATDNHAAFQVRTGMMNGAVHFFEEIGWSELPTRKVKGPWGQARFVSPFRPGCNTYQLTELSDGNPETLEMTENHIAINFSNATPEEAATAILDWAAQACAGEGSSSEKANSEGTKWFVYLPALFKFAIEIV
jgi:hypothetical protein